MTPWPNDLPRWDTLSADEKKLFARQAEVFAAYVAYTDNEIGRVIRTVQDLGKLDNTLIIYITGDNGTSAEGSLVGTPNAMTAIQAVPYPVADQMKVLRYVGLGHDLPAHVGSLVLGIRHTPFKWTKQVASHFGGTRQGMVMAWPARNQGRGRDALSVPPRHRHRTDHPRSHRDSGACDGQRHRAEADRRRQHGVHMG